MIDRLAERCAEWFGSVPFILFHAVWFALWFPLGGPTELLTLIVSLEAIFLSLFILRGEIVASRRTEQNVADDIDKSDEVLELLRELRDRKAP